MTTKNKVQIKCDNILEILAFLGNTTVTEIEEAVIKANPIKIAQVQSLQLKIVEEGISVNTKQGTKIAHLNDYIVRLEDSTFDVIPITEIQD